MERTTGCRRAGSARVAYRFSGKGPIDLVRTPSSFVTFDVANDDPMIELYFRRPASFNLLIRFDRRRTMKDSAVGFDTGFEDRGQHTLEGFKGEWQLHAATEGGAQ
jgi:hypothetical protein